MTANGAPEDRNDGVLDRIARSWLSPEGDGEPEPSVASGWHGRHLGREEIEAMRQEGLTYAEIGRRHGISRERVRQIATVRPARKKPDLMTKPTLTPGEVARLLGIHVGTVRKWANSGLLRSFRIGRRRDRRFLRDDILAFLNENNNGPGAGAVRGEPFEDTATESDGEP